MRTWLLTFWLVGASSLSAQDLGLKVAPGFRVTQVADHTLANDIYTLAFDEDGHLVVSGRGYIRRLLDLNGDGKFDRAEDIATTKTGAMGLAFHHRQGHESTMFAMKEGHLQIWGRTITERTVPPEVKAILPKPFGDHRWFAKDSAYEYQLRLPQPLPPSEHGGHAIRVGPDRHVYVVAGNDTPWDKVRDQSKLPNPEGGGIFRFSSHFAWQFAEYAPQMVAAGFRNPYDFDFTPLGDIITYDSDTERDYLLPWYMPTRVYHVMPGMNHGWRLPGYQRSLAKRDYYPDTVPMLADMGRGSPTGVCCYRHTQFPEHYRGGVFLLDWTFGKVQYLPLIPEGSSYRQVKPEMFIEATGQSGFAPTAARVGPDGALFVSIGGRGTRGAVYKVEYLGDGKEPVKANPWPKLPLDQVLEAPQPLDAWSWSKWHAALMSDVRLEELRKVYANEKESDARRIRAIEALVVHGVSPENPADKPVHLQAVVAGKSNLVKARLAWALGLEAYHKDRDPFLWQLAADADARVCFTALQGLWETRVKSATHLVTTVEQLRTLLNALNNDDPRVRLMASLLLPKLRDEQQSDVKRLVQDASARQMLAVALANVWQADPQSNTRRNLLVKAYNTAKTPRERTDALRGMTIFMGDWRLHDPAVELYSAYTIPGKPDDLAGWRLQHGAFLQTVRTNFPSKDAHENLEAARFMGMVRDGDDATIGKLLGQITRTSHPTDDVHYLIVLSLVRGDATPAQVAQIAAALLGLERKLAGRQLRIKQNWSVRFGELTAQLLKAHKGLAAPLVAHPDLVQPGHVAVVSQLPAALHPKAAGRFLEVVQKDGDFPLTADLVRLLKTLPRDQYLPLLRDRWQDYAARDAIIRTLAEVPDAADRDRFVATLDNSNADVALTCLQALLKLPPDKSGKNLVPVLRRLQTSFSEPKEGRVREAILNVLQRQMGVFFDITEARTDRAALEQDYANVFKVFAEKYPAEAKQLRSTSDEAAALLQSLPKVKWDVGNAERGAKLYKERGCLACHTGGSRIGPDLTGVTKRFSRDDLFTALVNPSRDVAPAYRVTNFDLKRGQRVSGIVIFESADGYMIQTNATEMKRLATEEIDSRTPSPKSLMPEGLLKDLRPEDLADIYTYLQTL